MNNDYLTYISHHGILGQRWGIRRYQYQDGSLTPEGKIRYGAAMQYNFHVPGNSEKYEKLDGKFESKEELKRSIKTNRTPEEYLDKVNPYFKQPGGMENCAYCSIAMEMNNRGYDVRARRSDIGMSANVYQTFFKNSKTEYYDTPQHYFNKQLPDELRWKMVRDDVHTKISNYGKNTSGIIGNVWKGGWGGHLIFWKVDDNGVPHFYDGQQGVEDEGIFFKNADLEYFSITRLDDCEFSDDIGKVVVSNREDKS